MVGTFYPSQCFRLLNQSLYIVGISLLLLIDSWRSSTDSLRRKYLGQRLTRINCNYWSIILVCLRDFKLENIVIYKYLHAARKAGNTNLWITTHPKYFAIFSRYSKLLPDLQQMIPRDRTSTYNDTNENLILIYMSTLTRKSEFIRVVLILTRYNWSKFLF